MQYKYNLMIEDYKSFIDAINKKSKAEALAVGLVFNIPYIIMIFSTYIFVTDYNMSSQYKIVFIIIAIVGFIILFWIIFKFINNITMKSYETIIAQFYLGDTELSIDEKSLTINKNGYSILINKKDITNIVKQKNIIIIKTKNKYLSLFIPKNIIDINNIKFEDMK